MGGGGDLDRLLIVGQSGGTNVGSSFLRSAQLLGIAAELLDASHAKSEYRFINSLCWRFLDKKMLRMRGFQKNLIEIAGKFTSTVLISTGMTPIDGSTINELKSQGCFCVNYSTDDPWNPLNGSSWFFRSLPHYDLICNPRYSNINDFHALGCKNVVYVPFGYDEFLFRAESGMDDSVRAPEVLFVGCADRERVDFIESLLKQSIPISLVGGYWDRYASVKAHALGHKSPDELSALTRAAKVNLCLVRRANRDGHVMRSFEMAALGACMVVEDTEEHRDIFGPEGECVVYFSDPHQAVAKIRMLLNQSAERRRLSLAVHARITSGGHTYTHRLQSMLQSAQELASSRQRHPSA